MTSPQTDAVRERVEKVRAHLLAQAEIENKSAGPCSSCRHSVHGHWLHDDGDLLCNHPLLAKQVFDTVSGEMRTVERKKCRMERCDYGELCKTEGRLAAWEKVADKS